MQARTLSLPHSVFKAAIFFRAAINGIMALTLISLSGCSALQKEPRLPAIPLLPPAALGQHVQLTQSVTLQINADEVGQNQQIGPLENQPLTLLAVWSVNEQGLNFAGLTPAGQVLMTLQYDGVHFTESYSPLLLLSNSDTVKSIPGREILAQLQLCYWPLPIIEQHLKNSPWRLMITDHGRALYLDKQLVLDIRLPPITATATGTTIDTTTGNSVTSDLNEVIEITNIIMRNQLTITTLTRAALPRTSDHE